METLNATTRLIDLTTLGRSAAIPTGVIAAAVIETPDGVLLVDPGPSSCLAVLRQELANAGIAPRDLRGLLLTHIHLDHAGASGTLVRDCPHLSVYVHERGAPHMIDPSKLLASAERLYGGEMDRLWGEFAAVPDARVTVLKGGETLAFGGRRIEVAYTPGHASHHVSYFDTGTGIAYTGDTAGIRIGQAPYVLPPTPPPDIDFDQWRSSIERIRQWQPSGVFLTHFGLKTDPAVHFDMMLEELAAFERVSRDLVDTEAPDARSARFSGGVAARIVEKAGDESAAAYGVAVSVEHCWLGLARYWSKRRPG